MKDGLAVLGPEVALAGAVSTCIVDGVVIENIIDEDLTVAILAWDAGVVIVDGVTPESLVALLSLLLSVQLQREYWDIDVCV